MVGFLIFAFFFETLHDFSVVFHNFDDDELMMKLPILPCAEKTKKTSLVYRTKTLLHTFCFLKDTLPTLLTCES